VTTKVGDAQENNGTEDTLSQLVMMEIVANNKPIGI